MTEVVCEPPSPRASATLIGSPSNSNELLLFGGEYYNGSLATFYNDLYIYLINRDEWRKVTSPNSPLPRSGHAWCRGGNAGGVYLFGGRSNSIRNECLALLRKFFNRGVLFPQAGYILSLQRLLEIGRVDSRVDST